MNIDQILGLILISVSVISGFIMMFSAVKELNRNRKIPRKKGK